MAGVDVGAERARTIVNALRGRGVLIGVTGPEGGTLKIRPPLIVSTDELDLLADELAAALAA
jgi:4-aminobutyrate aminotransferase-like enzyme